MGPDSLSGPGSGHARSSSCSAWSLRVTGAGGTVTRLALVAGEHPPYMSIAPGVLAARAIVQGRFAPKGVVFAHLHVEPAALKDYVRGLGIAISASAARP